MLNQNTTKTYNLSRDREKLTTTVEREEDELNKKHHKKKAKILNSNRISWFYDETAYVQLGEKAMKMVGLLHDFETCLENNYLPADIERRISNLKIANNEDDDVKYDETAAGGSKQQQELFDALHERRLRILQNKLLECFC